MKVMFNWQRLAYGTLVLSGITLGGAYWWARSGQFTATRDFVYLFQGETERCLPTLATNGISRVYTNTVINWVTNAAGRTYYIYTTNGTQIATNYWEKSGTTNYVYTNEWDTHKFRVALPDWNDFPALNAGTRPTFVTSSGRYIWNGYSNLVATGFVAAANGTYYYCTGGVYSVVDSNLYAGALSADDMFRWDTTKTCPKNPYVHVWTNVHNYHLVDAGPLEGYPYHLSVAASSIIFSNPPVLQPDYLTFYGDSPLNGPWFTWGDDRDDTPEPAGVTGAVYAANLMRDAECRQWINRYHDTSSDRERVSHIARVSEHMIDELYTVLTRLADGSVSYYLDHTATNASGVYVGVTNWSGAGTQTWQGLLTSWVTITNNLGEGMNPDHSVFTNVPAKYGYLNNIMYGGLKQTLRGMTGDCLGLDQCWFAHTYGTAETNTFYGYGKAEGINTPANLWTGAKAVAYTNFEDRVANGVGSRDITLGPYKYTKGQITDLGGGSYRLEAWIYLSIGDLVCTPLVTNISHTVDFYVLGRAPAVSGAENTFSAMDSGLSTNCYTYLGSVGPTNSPDPYYALGTTNPPNIVSAWWCDLPTVGTNVKVRGYTVTRLPSVHSEEAVVKWDFDYCTNSI